MPWQVRWELIVHTITDGTDGAGLCCLTTAVACTKYKCIVDETRLRTYCCPCRRIFLSITPTLDKRLRQSRLGTAVVKFTALRVLVNHTADLFRDTVNNERHRCSPEPVNAASITRGCIVRQSVRATARYVGISACKPAAQSGLVGATFISLFVRSIAQDNIVVIVQYLSATMGVVQDYLGIVTTSLLTTDRTSKRLSGTSPERVHQMAQGYQYQVLIKRQGVAEWALALSKSD